MVKVTGQHFAMASSVIAIVIAIGTVVLTYGRVDGASATVQAGLIKDMAEIKADVKSKAQLETTLQIQLGIAIERIDALNRRLDRIEQQPAKRANYLEPTLTAVAK